MTAPSRPTRRRSRVRRTLGRVLAALGAVVVAAVVGVVVWSQVGVYAPEPGPLAAVRADTGIHLSDEGGAIVMAPATADATGEGLVFLPGAKVDAWAYASTLSRLVAEDGFTVVITRPWLHLAVLDPRTLSAFTDLAPGVDRWLVLFASYCASDFAASGLPVLSVSGSEDGLSTPDKIAGARDLLPADAVMVEIPGAAHSSFGAYGPQAGDGTPAITRGRMAARIAELVSGFADQPDG